ncbi:hypothetical protein OIU79_029849 [Salix purpurea]|uniref:Uncharacterized protein n=1 Tax=Salix purpurea TaxID=77065 RepID=A0A9Q0VHF6_SALPP|nr:hypothetical protein OIU79_029849 [Salix purpurea]
MCIAETERIEVLGRTRSNLQLSAGRTFLLNHQSIWSHNNKNWNVLSVRHFCAKDIDVLMLTGRSKKKKWVEKEEMTSYIPW